MVATRQCEKKISREFSELSSKFRVIQFQEKFAFPYEKQSSYIHFIAYFRSK